MHDSIAASTWGCRMMPETFNTARLENHISVAGPKTARSLPFIPEGRIGNTHVVTVVHWSALPLEEAEKIFKPFREVAPIVAEHVGPRRTRR